MKLLHFGAGNIGRSFVGPLFLAAGYDVVFADVDTDLVQELSRHGAYDLVVCHPTEGLKPERISGVRAVNASDADPLRREASDAEIVSTSVGAGALRAVLTSILRALAGRRSPVNLLFAENAPGVSDLVRSLMRDYPGGALPPIGLIETSIGKMVPIVPDDIRARDPLQVRAEPYNTLICDRHGWIGGMPDVAGLCGVGNIAAYVHRKLFVHNLGHCAVAYFGFRADPDCTTIAEAVRIPEVRAGALEAMNCSVEALCAAYPQEFTREALQEHVDDLLSRFANPWLGDTVYRVGRDIPRKLGREERIIGAVRFCIEHGVDPAAIARVGTAALGFRASDETGAHFPADLALLERTASEGVLPVLQDVAGLHDANSTDRGVIALFAAPPGSDNV
ncbi:MAG: mannitol-1-phosphate 5-dehydrogenase [Spirochaetaceae bacterium]|nr:MAG: mannitol-1-phosphate 5-dehydrogenase [Spirochaetaceae bacterium]